GRITAVEQGLDSVTGSIAKQAITAKQADPPSEKPAERAMALPPPADAAVAQTPAPAPVAATAAEPPKDAPPKEALKDTPKDISRDAPKAGGHQAATPTTAASESIGKKADRSDSQRPATPPANAETTAANPAPSAQIATMQEADPAANAIAPKPG